MGEFNEKECWTTIMSRPGYTRTVNRNKTDKNLKEIEENYLIRSKLFNTYKDKLNDA